MSTTVLLVASNAGEERQVDAAFHRAGYTVLPCESFSGGRRALHEQRYALAVIDCALTDGNGLDLLVSAAGTPVIVLSDDVDVQARLSALRAGAVDCVGKPYDPIHLVARGVSVLNLAKGMPPVSGWGFARRLMVVDDSTTYAGALADELRKDGHDVTLARAAHEALAFGAAQELDLAIVDAFLPDMNGVELCARLRAIPALRRTPVLLLTGREKSAVRSRALDAEATDLLVKSRDLESVRMHVRRMLFTDERPAPSSRRGTLPVATYRSVPPPASTRAGTPASQRSVPPPASHHSVPPPSSYRSGAPTSHRSVPPPASNRSVPPPSSYRSVPPPPSRRDGPPSSQLGPGSSREPPSSHRASPRRAEAFKLGETPKPPAQPESPLLEQLAAASGLSKLVARGAVERACWRAGVKPSRLAPHDLERVVAEMEQVLKVFLPPDVVALRLSEMARLGR